MTSLNWSSSICVFYILKTNFDDVSKYKVYLAPEIHSINGTREKSDEKRKGL